MAGETTTVVLRSQPGIKRDGTRFDGDCYTDGQWVRFQRGLPRKIAGYRSISKYFQEVSRGFTSYTQTGTQYCHTGSATLLERVTIDSTFNSSTVTDRTPTTLTASTDNKWMFDYEFDSSITDNSIIAHVAPNNSCICNDTGGQIFNGAVLATEALIEITIPDGANATGGIVALHPYLFYYGSAGVVGWSVPGTLNNLTGEGSGIARVWGQKIIKGLPLRAGAGAAPAGIFWAYDAVIRASFIGGSTVFQFDVLASSTSIMSPDSVIDYDGVFYWAGVDRFMMFNGVVRDLPNDMSHNWFFKGINRSATAKVFAFKVPYFGEIWWCYPRGSAIECTHAVIYNVKQNIWYDTELPASMRTAACYNNGYAAPLMMDGTESADGFKLWIHEQGMDKIDGTSVQPIESYFETADLSSLVQGQDSGLRINRIEPDFVQVGPMTVQVTGRANAKAQEVLSRIYTFPETPATPQEQIIMLKEQRRELRVKFSSNALNGDYQMGQVIAHISAGDGTVLGSTS